MIIRFHENFVRKLTRQVVFIANDKPHAAKKFKKDLLSKIRLLTEQPFMCRKSIYFEDENIRDLVFKRHVITYKVDTEKKPIDVFGLTKMDLDPES